MNHREYWTKCFKRELGELDTDDREVLEDTISFYKASEGISKLF